MRWICSPATGLLLLAIGGQVLAQPEPWVHPDGSIHYYWAIDAPDGIDWNAASDSAARMGGYLATLTSQAENDLVFGLVNLRPYWYRRPGTGYWAGPWLGGRQRSGSPEPDSGWEWVTGEPCDYTNWSCGQPNNLGGDQDALNLGESPYGWLPTWNDLSTLDTAIHGYVVELSAESTTIGLLQNDTNACAGYTLFESSRSPVAYLMSTQSDSVIPPAKLKCHRAWTGWSVQLWVERADGGPGLRQRGDGRRGRCRQTTPVHRRRLPPA